VIPQHLSESSVHCTPSRIVEPSRSVMGGIDLDPASSAEANKTVRALTYVAPPFDGLTSDWYGRVFLNPPGGNLIMTEKIRATMTEEEADELVEQWAHERKRWKTKSRAVAWWRKLTEEYLDGRCREAIFVGFNLDILHASQGQGDVWPDVLKFPICVPLSRIRFEIEGVPGNEPTHGNVIVYLPNLNVPDSSLKFGEVFREIGSVSI
jgi:hypothetical protein